MTVQNDCKMNSREPVNMTRLSFVWGKIKTHFINIPIHIK